MYGHVCFFDFIRRFRLLMRVLLAGNWQLCPVCIVSERPFKAFVASSGNQSGTRFFAVPIFTSLGSSRGKLQKRRESGLLKIGPMQVTNASPAGLNPT